MKKTGSHDFEYYEEKAAYFQYTHNDDEWDEPLGDDDEYCDLPMEVFDLIQKRAERDVKHDRPMLTRHELEEILLDAGLLKYGKTAAVMDELHWDYRWTYDAAKEKNNRAIEDGIG